ncbi:hypothetical protein GRZ55_06130 [Chelativorans sp. ZYF759]|uniref:hypothetical protein n=1 Tax=Chelativorans sp. ZYF759 TaxID=2692213 RepID=UPI00145EA4D2|nr:hypothetical protein [Chelativorans sp. ZYF759]NMG38820.1 hypothetical protein [Chelativorans sp. ZYF759]
MAQISFPATSGDPRPVDASASVYWIAIAAAVGFAVPAVFSTWLQLERGLFLIPYVLIVGAFVAYFFRTSGVRPSLFANRWALGLVGAAFFGFYVVQNVVGQPGSEAPAGVELAWALLWFGVVYGLVDALFLNVLPVLFVGALGNARSSRTDLALRGLLGIVASALIAGAYHFGFAEFQGLSLLAPVFGNSLLTLSFVLTRSPLAPIGAHIAMHIAGVLHGMESVVQLPPHY